jgi:hypothetical protein
MSEIKPIQTRYKGYHFRSRLEARYAVFFDALGLDWEYENEGFDLGNGVYYLPDFCVTSIDGSVYYYEIKPKNGACINDKVDALSSIFTKNYNESPEYCRTTYRDIVLLCGDPYLLVIENSHWENFICPRCGFIHPYDQYCFSCDMHTESGRGNPIYDSVIFKGVKYTPSTGNIDFADDISKTRYEVLIMNAALSARSARFEHDQSGA